MRGSPEQPKPVRRTTPVRVERLVAAAAERMREIVAERAEIVAYDECINLQYSCGGGGVAWVRALPYSTLPVDQALRFDLQNLGLAVLRVPASPYEQVDHDRVEVRVELTETEARVWYGDRPCDATDRQSRWRPILLAEIGL